MRALFFAPLLGALGACAHQPAVGRGGDVYEIVIHTIDGRLTATKGHAGYPACTIQVGEEVQRVWLARDPPDHPDSPVILVADAEALRAGVMLEIGGWNWATIHRINEDELAAEAALVYVPGPSGPHEVELRFRRIPEVALRERGITKP